MALRVGNRPSEAALGKVPPHNLEAEESVLGACLISREAIANVLEILGNDDFYKPAHNEIFHTILELYGRGDPVDAVTLAEELRRRDKLEAVGGKPYLFKLVQSVPTPGSAAHYAKIVEENALLRRLIEASHTISDMAYNIPEDVEAAIDMSEDLIYQVSQRRDSSDFQALKDLLTENMEMVEKLYERGSSITGLPTGFTELDNITAGLQPSNLIIVAARPAMGKSSLAVTMAQYVAVEQHAPVVIFSLEMSKMELVQRLMCAEARVDSNRLRRGMLQDSDWPKLSHALGRLAEAPIFIDDTASVTIMEMRAKCRRLKAKHGLSLVIVDYLQLMQPHPGRRSDNRVQEVSEISRALKILARELEVPVIAVSQLSRNVEHRTDKRPMLADLRESGCLTGDTRVALSDGSWVPIEELVGQKPIVMTLNAQLQIESGRAVKVWKTGRKSVFKLTTRGGKVIRATANHPFRTLQGWQALGELAVGDRIAMARVLPDVQASHEWDQRKLILLAHLIGDGSMLKGLPLRYATRSMCNLEAVADASKAFGITSHHKWSPQARSYQLFLPSPVHCTHGVRNPANEWLVELGVYDKRSHEKFVPSEIFTLSNQQIALFLKHLWATDGCIWTNSKGRIPPRIYYSSSSRRLANDVDRLLLRLGIRSAIKSVKKEGYRDNYHVLVTGMKDQNRFLDPVGGFGEKALMASGVRKVLEGLKANTNVDTIPREVWAAVKTKMKDRGISHRQMAAQRGVTYGGTAQFKFAPSRPIVSQYASILQDDELRQLAESHVFWDDVKSIELDGEEDVYDMTVPGTHNFLADGFVVHNSIEQDSDIVMFIYRDEVYNPDSTQKGIAEIIIAKHRNGPIGKVDLAFLDHYTKFANLARGV